jgi:hypothetical protein
VVYGYRTEIGGQGAAEARSTLERFLALRSRGDEE